MGPNSTTTVASPAPAQPSPVPGLRPEDIPSLEHIQTEDDTPVDNIYSLKQMFLLVDPLYNSWEGPGEGRKFLAVANVGLFYAVHKPPLVPDAMLSLDVELGEDHWAKENRSYFIWILGKPPEVVIEVVSNREGEEDTRKFRLYAQLGILYYVIWDPEQHLRSDPLRIFTLSERRYVPLQGSFLPVVGLGLTTWQGTYENWTNTWLRWSDASGVLIPTGAERAEQERQQAEQERQRAEQERQRAERLVAQLRALGVDPDSP
ncbi:MAG: Uma2 family endonuclease [Planctomycetes bacterium]|nr:Uma2 family endonuclease [Planctomycetota bacterium]